MLDEEEGAAAASSWVRSTSDDADNRVLGATMRRPGSSLALVGAPEGPTPAPAAMLADVGSSSFPSFLSWARCMCSPSAFFSDSFPPEDPASTTCHDPSIIVVRRFLQKSPFPSSTFAWGVWEGKEEKEQVNRAVIMEQCKQHRVYPFFFFSSLLSPRRSRQTGRKGEEEVE